MEREAFLAKVRTGSRTGIIPAASAEDPGLLVPELPAVDLVARFRDRLENMHGNVLDMTPAEAVAHVIDTHEVETFLAWDVEHIDGLDELPSSIERVTADIPSDREGRRAANDRFYDVRLGITGAEAGLAESGTIVLRSGPGRPRMASLVPLVHLAVLRADRIVRSSPHWFGQAAGTMGDATNVVFITGPSKTGDIEMIHTYGIHGPERLYVVLV